MRRLLFLFCILFSCMMQASTPQKPTPPAYWPLIINGFIFSKVELALTEQATTRGLSHRSSIPSDGGMLFVFDSCKTRTFWMRDCLVNIDVAFMDADGVIVATYTMSKESPQRSQESLDDYLARLKRYSSIRPAQFVLELAEGQLALLGLRTGDTLEISPDRLLKLLP